MNWIREAISDGQTGKASAKRIAMLSATWSLAIAVVILAVASLIGYEVAASLGAVAVPLAGLGGYSYVNGKAAELKRTLEPK
jgi:hypothetical protein